MLQLISPIVIQGQSIYKEHLFIISAKYWPQNVLYLVYTQTSQLFNLYLSRIVPLRLQISFAGEIIVHVFSCRGNRSTRMKPTQTWGEHANSTHSHKLSFKLTFKGFQEILGNIPTNGLKIRKLKEVWCFQTAFHFITLELHANIKIMKEISSKCHAVLRSKNTMDPACRGCHNQAHETLVPHSLQK